MLSALARLGRHALPGGAAASGSSQKVRGSRRPRRLSDTTFASVGGHQQVKSAYYTGTHESKLAIGARADRSGEIYNPQSRESWFECMPGSRIFHCSNSPH
jgi:hypothetical protein